jgi:uncharacterized protein YlxW (UPF0749 family)
VDDKSEKKKKKSEDTARTAKEQAWLEAEARRIEAQATLDKANEDSAAAASDLAEEKIADGKNGVVGPGGVTYTVQKGRKAKGSEEPPRYPFTLRRAAEIRT